MPSWIHLAAAKHPDRVAIEGPERNLTYAELARAAFRPPVRCSASASSRERRSRWRCHPARTFVIALHGGLLSGHPMVPIDLRLSQREREQRLAGAMSSSPSRCRGPSSPGCRAGPAGIRWRR